MFMTPFKGGRSNAYDTPRWYMDNSFSFAIAAMILTGAEAGVGDVVSLESMPDN